MNEKITIAVLNYAALDVEIVTVNIEKNGEELLQCEQIEEKLEELGYRLKDISYMTSSENEINLKFKNYVD